MARWARTWFRMSSGRASSIAIPAEEGCVDPEERRGSGRGGKGGVGKRGVFLASAFSLFNTEPYNVLHVHKALHC